MNLPNLHFCWTEGQHKYCVCTLNVLSNYCSIRSLANVLSMKILYTSWKFNARSRKFFRENEWEHCVWSGLFSLIDAGLGCLCRCWSQAWWTGFPRRPKSMAPVALITLSLPTVTKCAQACNFELSRDVFYPPTLPHTKEINKSVFNDSFWWNEGNTNRERTVFAFTDGFLNHLRSFLGTEKTKRRRRHVPRELENVV